MRNVCKIPLLFHPGNTLFIDDDPVFLNSMRLAMKRDVAYITNDNPPKALNYLRSHTYQQISLPELIIKQNFDITDSFSESAERFDIDFSFLCDKLDNPERFKKIINIFVDQSMPKMDGLDFCRAVREEGFLVKLILLTGKMGTGDAVRAFNEGIIDAYIPKDHPELLKTVNEHIKNCSWQLFKELSNSVGGFMSHIAKPIYDEHFFEIFDKIFQRHNLCEFYLLNSSCSFLCIDAMGKAKILYLRNENDFNELYDIAKDSKAPYDILENIRGRQQFAFTRGDKGYLKLKEDMWKDFMYSVDKIPGRDLYYALIDRPDIEVFAFKKYLMEIWPQP